MEQHLAAAVGTLRAQELVVFQVGGDARGLFTALSAYLQSRACLPWLSHYQFSILHFPYDTVIKAFQSVEIDATYDDNTPHEDLESKIQAWNNLSSAQRLRVAGALVEIDSEEVRQFIRELEVVVTRQTEMVRVTTLHGSAAELTSVEQAIGFVQSYDEERGSEPFVRYEIEVHYKNGDRINGFLTDKESAIQFLRAYVPPKLHPARQGEEERS